MINVENEIFGTLYEALMSEYPETYVTGEYVNAPAQMPCVSIIEADNLSYMRTRDTASNENHVEVLYEVNIYSNKVAGRKNEAKALLTIVDSKLDEMGFTKVMTSVIPNEADSTIFRIVARYRAIISKDKVIYRR